MVTPDKVLRDSEVLVYHDISVIILYKTPGSVRQANTIIEQVPSEYYSSLINGVDFCALILPSVHTGRALRSLRGLVKQVESDLVLVFIKSPKSIYETPGVLSTILELFNNKKANINEFYSFYLNTIILLEKKEYKKVEKALKSKRRKRL